jgi:hypothetical protein
LLQFEAVGVMAVEGKSGGKKVSLGKNQSVCPCDVSLGEMLNIGALIKKAKFFGPSVRE